MSFYAFLNSDNIIESLIFGIAETEFIDGMLPEVYYERFSGKKCCLLRNGNPQSRSPYKNEATTDYILDESLGGFRTQQSPYPSWTLNTSTCQYDPPVPIPDTPGAWMWNEEFYAWELFNPQ